MKIIEKVADKQVLRFMVDSDEMSLFQLLKTYLEKDSDVDLVGVYREHHLINKTEFFLKTKKADALDLFKKSLEKTKKELNSMKVK